MLETHISSILFLWVNISKVLIFTTIISGLVFLIPSGRWLFVPAISETTGGRIQVVFTSPGSEYTCFRSSLWFCLRSFWASLSFSAAFDFPLQMWKTWTSSALICLSKNDYVYKLPSDIVISGFPLVKQMKTGIKSKPPIRCAEQPSLLLCEKWMSMCQHVPGLFVLLLPVWLESSVQSSNSTTCTASSGDTLTSSCAVNTSCN